MELKSGRGRRHGFGRRLHRTIWYMGAKARVIPGFLDRVVRREVPAGGTTPAVPNACRPRADLPSPGEPDQASVTGDEIEMLLRGLE